MNQVGTLMKHVGTLMFAALALGACTSDYRGMTEPVTERHQRMTDQSDLEVPSNCPIYTPTGGDIDTPELPYESPVRFACGVDAAGSKYGLVTGDTGDLAIVRGNREIGLYVAFDANSHTQLTAAQLGFDGDSPAIQAWSAPVDVTSQECCAEHEPNAEIPMTLVALGAHGMLLSLGDFDATPTQVAISYMNADLFPNAGFSPNTGYMWRFYVNDAVGSAP
ncbi:MAG TPA: hypothetical protein VGM90_34730 [Kofleriaceae bacterium]